MSTPSRGTVLRVEQVSKTYPSQPPVVALREVSFTVAPGELVAIVGPSGSGKTTLLHVLGTLDRPTSGQVLVTGLDVARLSDRELATLRATRIGFVFQQFFLAEHATALDNVADGLPPPPPSTPTPNTGTPSYPPSPGPAASVPRSSSAPSPASPPPSGQPACPPPKPSGPYRYRGSRRHHHRHRPALPPRTRHHPRPRAP
jgi:ABC-type oligopeptide transport system ATPase subunit